jgi:hypothetical protein
LLKNNKRSLPNIPHLVGIFCLKLLYYFIK